MTKKAHILVEVQITRGFENEENALKNEVKKQLTISLNSLVKRIKENGWDNRMYRTKHTKFPLNINRKNSTLYLFNGTNNHSVILSYEDDPLFKQKLITLYRVVDKKTANSVFTDTLINLHKKWM